MKLLLAIVTSLVAISPAFADAAAENRIILACWGMYDADYQSCRDSTIRKEGLIAPSRLEDVGTDREPQPVTIIRGRRD